MNIEKLLFSNLKKAIILFMTIAGVLSIASIASAAAPTSGLVGYWNFDGNANDFSGNGNNGTVNGTASWVNGKINQAISLNGSSYISVPNVKILNPGSSLQSVSAWVKQTSDGSILWKGSSSSDTYELAVKGGKATFTINAGGATVNATAVSSASINDGNWHLITGVRSSTKTADIYVDGVLSGTMTYAGSGASIDTTTPLTIGSRNGSNFLSGLIDDVRIYNRALSPSEVMDIYNAVATGGSTPTADTIAPTISLSAPSSGTTVSGSITISATASDNIGVVGVQFKLDGSNLNVEKTSTPYSISWDTTNTANGIHTLSALARDAVGNTTISSSVTVTVLNNSSIKCTYPANILDLTNWKETLPIGSSGSPIEIYQPQLATYVNNPYFVVNSGCNGVQFRAPVNGVATSNSGYPRSELREMTNNGATNASWATNSGINTMFIDEAITAVPQNKQHVVAGQVHNATDDVMVIRLEYPKLFIDIHGITGPTLDNNYVLGRRFTVKFVASNGQISVYYNGSTTPSYTLKKIGSGNYFKAGVYTQSNCTKETSCNSNNYGEVNIYNVWVQHQSISSILDITAPTVPNNLTASAISSSQINLSWTASTDNIGVTGYKIFRNGIQIAIPTNVSYFDTGLTANTSYTYSVVASDAAGNTSPQSLSVLATTQAIQNPTSPIPSPGGGGGGGTTPSTNIGNPNGGGGVPTGNQPAPTPTPDNIALPIFTKVLYIGMTSLDVKILQKFLNSDLNSTLASTGPGSPGQETEYFGFRTRESVKKFQATYGIVSSGNEETTGYGVVGPKTIAKLNEIFGLKKQNGTK